MENNMQMFHYLKDEYLSPILASRRCDCKEQECLACEFLSILKIGSRHDRNPIRWFANYLIVLATRILGTF
jgi:hypothetical protein